MKPLGRKNYGSIGHLPNSRLGPSDRSVHEGQGRICTIKTRDKHDFVIVTEKLDGSNVGIANVDGEIFPLTRSGYVASTSPYGQHHAFYAWALCHREKWLAMLEPGERLIGEWMAVAAGTKYTLPLGPFAAFDLMTGGKRLPHNGLVNRCARYHVPMPRILHIGGAISVEDAMLLHGEGDHGCDEPEGVVYRVERGGEFDFMAKWVRPDKIDGKYLVGTSAAIVTKDVWNWI
jgi:RNA ligase